MPLSWNQPKPKEIMNNVNSIAAYHLELKFSLYWLS